MQDCSRRKFLVKSAAFISAASAFDLFAAPSLTPLVETRNASPAQLVGKAVEMLGGMGAFVKPGQSVLIKPNIAWDRVPEQAATTNPDIVAHVVKMCLHAGAKKVRVLDRTCNQARRCYKRSGIEAAAKKAGAEVRFVVDSRFRDVAILQGRSIKTWPVYKDALEFDVLVNIPIAKTHSVSRVTLGMKNLMGLLGGDRGELHKNFDEKIVDINTILRPALTIVDAYRVLMHNGPSGGSLDDVAEKKTVIAGSDPVAVDAHAASLFGIKAQELPFLVNASKRGLGQIDVDKMRLKTFDFRA